LRKQLNLLKVAPNLTLASYIASFLLKTSKLGSGDWVMGNG
jgi:hypothetical protein